MGMIELLDKCFWIIQGLLEKSLDNLMMGMIELITSKRWNQAQGNYCQKLEKF